MEYTEGLRLARRACGLRRLAAGSGDSQRRPPTRSRASEHPRHDGSLALEPQRQVEGGGRSQAAPGSAEQEVPRHAVRGASSEKTDRDGGKSDEPDTDADAPPPVGPKQKAVEAATASPHAPKKRGVLGRQKVDIPAHLPREPRIIEPEHGVTCGCGFELRKVGEQVIERLTYEPTKIYVIEEHYPKYACRCCGKFVQARVPKQAFDYTRFDDPLIAGLLVGKFADFLPNYRQEEILKRSGVRLSRSTMARLTTQAVDALLPVFDALKADIKSSSKLLMDETVMPQLLPGSGRTKTGYAWALCRDDRRWCGTAPPGVVFHFRQSRGGEHAEEILQGYGGILQVDGYGGYNRLTQAGHVGGPLTLAFCWAHVRSFLTSTRRRNPSKPWRSFRLSTRCMRSKRV